jgi:ribosomal protein S18 acetylase RimI-like enzyme
MGPAVRSVNVFTMTNSATTIAGPRDEAELDAFLTLHTHSSLYLRAELRRGWNRPLFAIVREQDRIVAAATQSITGMVLLQAPINAGAVAAAVLAHGTRPLAGFFGPLAQVRAARSALQLDATPALKDTAEDLFALKLEHLKPPALTNRAIGCRIAGEGDTELLTAWRYAFRQATLQDVPGEQLLKTSRGDIAHLLPAGSLFILEADEPLACCSFNARLPDVVQIGNVWTPPQWRGRGYGRAVVAGALAIARKTGVTEAILATGRHNAAAQAAYRAIGFEVVGDYATLTFAPGSALPPALQGKVPFKPVW